MPLVSSSNGQPLAFDVVVVGAGLSGVNAGYYLETQRPRGQTYVILEGREAIGGTWDLFRYPGIRSDSDMYTLGYPFRPWRGDKAIADGGSIRDYIRETACVYGIEPKIRFGHRVERASWSSDAARWTVEARRTDTGEIVRFTCRFLFMCSGYYDYAGGYTPEFPGVERYRGRVVHPQKWTDDIDYGGKRVVVIGSGATAVTLVPEMAKLAARVTMLQRSPTYILSMPAVDVLAKWVDRRLPLDIGGDVSRLRNVALAAAMYKFCRAYPERAKKILIRGVRRQLGPDFDVATHFTPRYRPWEQRLCLVPDGDLFQAMKRGRADVVTDHIDTFTETGIRLRSGAELEADLIVTATGLKVLLLGGVKLSVDGAPVEPGKTTSYKGAMLSDVPNLAVALGYTNASWTLKSDLVCRYVLRVLEEMDRNGYRICTPQKGGRDFVEEPLFDFSSGYVQRAVADLPKQGDKAPWRLYQNYFLDRMALQYGALDDGVMRFAR
ncbi:MAG: NAD(P)/FAD-dependent oxidoreductase [Labilithrix sp.]|nr:NAD(P)/FAD-dependent oxidoreductase [Labilithrix sp.]